MRKIVPLILAMLMACTPLMPGGSASLPETGIVGASSRQVVIANEGHIVMVGQVFVLRRSGGIAFTAEVGQMRHGGLGRLRMDEAWENGVERPFVSPGRAERYCIAWTGCQGYRTGTFVLTATEFATAMHEGMHARLVGPDGTARVAFPASLFVEAMGRATEMGLWTAETG